jgi:glucose-induced degradation protein 8
LAPKGEENEEFLEELERSMALLAFDLDSTSPVSYLLDHSHRQKIASELNAAILSAQSQDKEAKLPTLIKMLLWAQNQLSEKANFPLMTNLTTGELADTSAMEL